MKKSILKTVVAAAVVATTMAVSSVAAFAAAKTYYYVDDKSSTENTENYFTVTGGGSNSGISSSSYNFEGEDAKTPTSCVKFNSSGNIKFTVVGTATVEVAWSNKGAATDEVGIKLTDGASTVHNSETTTNDNSTIIVSKFTDIPSGEATIERQTSKELCVYGVKVVDTVSDNAKEYKITGTSNLPTDVTSFSLGDYTANVSEGGNWTVSQTAETAPFKTGDKLTVSLAEYSAEPTEVTLSQGTDAYTFNGGAINFTKLPLGNIAAGTYEPAAIEKGLPDFDKSELKVSSSGKYTGTLKFKLEKNAKVTVNAKCGSTDTSKSVTLTLGTLNETIKGESNASPKDYVAYLPAGENNLVIVSSDTTLQIHSITIDYIDDGLTTVTNGGVYVSGPDSYIIAKVSQADTAKDSLTITIGDKTQNTSTVYKSVKIDEATVTADQVSGDYLYAIKVIGANGNPAVNNFTVG